MEKDMKYILEKLKNSQIILWGTGWLGEKVYEYLFHNDVKVSAAWDKNYEEIKEFHGIVPEKPLENPKHRDKLLIICVGNNELRRQLYEKASEKGFNFFPDEQEINLLFKKAVGEVLRLQKDMEAIQGMSLEQRLEKAIQFAVDSDHAAWEWQCAAREHVRMAKNLVLLNVADYMREKKFWDRYQINNGLSNLKWLCDFDSKYFGQEYGEKRCISPQEMLLLEDLMVLVIGKVTKEQTDFMERNQVPYYLVSRLETSVFDKRFSREWFMEEKEGMMKALALFEDDWSKKVYTDCICQRIAPQLALMEFHEMNSEEEEYFDSTVWKLGKNECYVDAGAYRGDTFEAFYKCVGGEFEEAYLFEMDKENYDQMTVKLQEYEQEKLHMFNAGLFSANMTRSYIKDAGSSNLSLEGAEQAEVVTLDTCINKNKVTFYKLDVEGAEMDALEGSIEILKTWQPKIACSVYHHMYDLWRIPNFLKETDSRYRFKLRHCTNYIWDTDLYAYIE